MKEEYSADILTGCQIVKMRAAGQLTIQPYSKAQVGPNSYTYRLGPKLGVPVIGEDGGVRFDFITIPRAGYVLEPHTMYLGHTHEKLGSDVFAMSLIGRKEMGLLGVFTQVAADLGHTGACHQWTLEIVAAKPVRLYPGMKIGQISFMPNHGDAALYRGGYARFNAPHVSRQKTSR